MPRQQKSARKPPSAKKPPLTHFLCLPLGTPSSKPQLEASIETFRKNVSPNQQPELQTEQTPNLATHIHPKAIRPVEVLHLTLGVMSLDEEKLQKAIDLLANLNINHLLSNADAAAASQIPDQSPMNSTSTSTTESVKPAPPPGQPITIDLKGLASMHTPNNTSILYVPPSDPTQRLYPFCLALQKIFQTEGFLLPDNRDLKLHATIVNTIYAKGRKKRPAPPPKEETRPYATSPSHPPYDPSGEPSKAEDREEKNGYRSQPHLPHSNFPLKFDASALLEEYKDFVWAEDVVLDRIAICEMGAKVLDPKNGEVVGEEYVEVARVGLPVFGGG
jgi:activating signal cointegrator complex subunit 1